MLYIFFFECLKKLVLPTVNSFAASLQQNSSALRVASHNAKAATNDDQISKPCTSKFPRESPTARLTQTNLALSPDNQVKLVTRKQRKKVKSHQVESTKENTRRKRKSPLQPVLLRELFLPFWYLSPTYIRLQQGAYYRCTWWLHVCVVSYWQLHFSM